MKPFRAYFTSETAPEEGSRLLIHSHITLDQTDGIQELGTAQKSTPLSGVYHISGQQVRGAAHATVEETLQSLPAGIYVINGKKYKK